MTENHRATTVGDEHGQVRPELLFPWSDGDGLTVVLRDSKLWAAAFAYPSTRRLIKSAGKRCLDVRGIAHTDGEQIGELVVQLLSTRRGRSALYDELKKLSREKWFRRHYENVPMYVARSLNMAVGTRGLAIPPRLHRQQGEKHYLHAAGLDSEAWRDWSPTDVLLACSPYLILQRNEVKPLVAGLKKAEAIAALLEEEAIAFAAEAVPRNAAAHDSARSGTALNPTIQPEGTRGSTPPARAVPATSSSDSAPERDRGASRDSRLGDLHAALKQAVEATQRARSALDSGELDVALTAGADAVRLKAQVVKAYEGLRSREDVVSRALDPEVPKTALTEMSHAERWLDDLDEVLVKHEAHRVSLVRRRRDSLIANFQELGLATPSDLAAADTLEQVQAIRERETQTLLVEAAWRGFLTTGEISALATLPVEHRVRLSARLYEPPVNANLALLLFVSDRDVSRATPLERLVPLLKELIESRDTYAPGVWRALRERSGSSFLSLLDAHGVTQLLTTSLEPVANEQELREILCSIDVPIAHPLFAWSLEQRAESLSPDERIALLVEVSKVSSSPKALEMLLSALCSVGRARDAVFLAAAAWHERLISEVSLSTVRRAFLKVLTESCAHPDRHALLKNILEIDELGEDVEGFLCALFIASNVTPQTIDTIVYRNPESYQAAIRLYPTLVSEWLLKVRAGFLTKDTLQARERELLHVQSEYAEWTRELARKSAYASWPAAEKYQRHILEWMRARFSGLQNGVGVDLEIDPDELIDDIEDDHTLPRVEGPARRNMQSQIKAQLGRLRTFDRFWRERREGVQGTLQSVLETPHRSLSVRLEEEVARSEGIVRELYSLAIKECSFR